MAKLYTLRKRQINEFFKSARERYRIMLYRRNGEEYKTEKVYEDWRFCNVFREDDRVTMWVRENVREPMRNDPKVILAMAMCRLFNREPSLEPLLQPTNLFKDFDPIEVASRLKGVKPVTCAAYRVITPAGMSKLNGVINILENSSEELFQLATRMQPGVTTLEETWHALRTFKFYGPFISYEIVSDLRHTYLLENAPDIMTWANAGPGARQGMSWLVGKTFGMFEGTSKKEAQDLVHMMQRILALSQMPEFWPKKWPQWEMREVEHWLCEYAKYVKAKHQKKRLKRSYRK